MKKKKKVKMNLYWLEQEEQTICQNFHKNDESESHWYGMYEIQANLVLK